MKVEIINHLLFIDGKQVKLVKTPNVSSGTNKLQYIIEHYTAAWNAAGSISWLTSKESGVSAHLVIDRDGTVTQLAPFDKITWHAGQSSWGKINGLNSYSIGIENANSGILTKRADGYYSPDGHKIENCKRATNNFGISGMFEVWPDKQVEVIVAVTKALVSHYKIIAVLGHEEISPQRKIDPAPLFPWSLIRGGIAVANTKVTTSALNLRESPSTSSKVLRVIPEGTVVSILSERDGWSKLSEGYVSSKYLI